MKNTSLKRAWRFVVIGIALLVLVLIVLPLSTAGSDTDIIPTEAIEIIETVPDYSFELSIMEHVEYHQYIPLQDKAAIQMRQEVFKTYIGRLYGVLAQYDFKSEQYTIAYDMLNPEILRSERIIQSYENDYQAILAYEAEEAFWAEKAAGNKFPLPVATQVWRIMSEEFGWNDTVCAGIMGNLMAECGGCWTKDLNWQSNHSGGLGMIQWIGGRRKEIKSIYGDMPNVEEQLQFMYDELHGTNGVTRQVSAKQLAAIMNAETPEECAYLFALYYERPNSQHIPHRRGLARTSYDYFTN